MIYVIYGDERLLMDQKLEAIKKEYNCNDDNMNLSTYHLDEVNLDMVIEDLLTPPFLTDKKMVVLKNCYFLTSKTMKKDNNESDKFLDCLAKDSNDTILVIFHEPKDFDERKKVVKKLRSVATIFEIDKVNHYKLAASIRQAVKKRDAVIEDEAIELLLSRIGDNLTDVAREVDKLCLYTKNINVEAINLLVCKPLEENVFDLTNALLNKKRDKMFMIYKDLMVLNEEPIKLIVMIANSMRLMYQVKLLDRKGYNDKEIAKILSVNPFRLKYIRQEGKDFDLNELLKCLDELSELDIKIKTGKIDKHLGLELFMIKI